MRRATNAELPGVDWLELPAWWTLTFVILTSAVGRWLDVAAYPLAFVAATSLWWALHRWRIVPLRRPEGGASLVVPLVVLALVAVASHAYLSKGVFGDARCHHSLVNAVLRTGLPIPEPGVPTQPSAYHFGFDVLAAGLRLAGLSPDTESALDLASLWALLCAGWAALGVWRRWRVPPAQMAMGLVLLLLAAGLLRWLGEASTIPYESSLRDCGGVYESGTFRSLAATMLSRRGHILGTLALLLGAGTLRDHLGVRLRSATSTRVHLSLGLRFGLLLASSVLCADHTLPLLGVMLLGALVLTTREHRRVGLVGVVVVAVTTLAMSGGGHSVVMLDSLTPGAEPALAWHWRPTLPSFVAAVDGASWTHPEFWEAIALEFGPLALLPVLMCIPRYATDRRYGLVLLVVEAAGWALALCLALPRHHNSVDVHRFAASAQHLVLFHAPVVATSLVRRGRVGPRTATLILAAATYLYLPKLLIPVCGDWDWALRPELVVAPLVVYGLLGRRKGWRVPTRATGLILAALMAAPLLVGALRPASVADARGTEPVVLFEDIVSELGEAGLGRAVLARPRMAHALVLQGYPLAEGWRIGTDRYDYRLPDESPPGLRPVAGTAFALLDADDLRWAERNWPGLGFEIVHLRPLLGANLLLTQQPMLLPRRQSCWPRALWFVTLRRKPGES